MNFDVSDQDESRLKIEEDNEAFPTNLKSVKKKFLKNPTQLS